MSVVQYQPCWEWIHAQTTDQLRSYLSENEGKDTWEEVAPPWGGMNELRGDILEHVRDALASLSRIT
jgi:hypothetical protein